MIFSRKELKILGPFYLQNFITNLSKVILPFYVLYFVSIGLSFFQIAMLGAVRSLVGLIFEVPTGAIADLFGRKFSVILGYFLTAITVTCVILTDNFYFLALILGLDALFQTLISGADRAWAYDSAKQESDHLAEKYFFKRKALCNAGMIIAPVIAALIVRYFDMGKLWVIYGIGLMLSAIILIPAKNVNIKQDDLDDEKDSKNFIRIFSHIKDVIKFLKNKPALLYILAAVFFFYFIEEITSLAWTPFLQDEGFRLETIGYLFSVISILGVIFPIIIGKMLPRSRQLLGLIIISIFYTALLISAGLLGQIFVLAVIFVIVSIQRNLGITVNASRFSDCR